MSRLNGKTALVTGAASGLGRAIAAAYAREGAQVFLSDIDEAGLTHAVAEIGDRGTALTFDIVDEAGWISAFAQIGRDAGGLDILVNSAGITTVGSIEDLSLDAFRHILDVDLTSIFLACKHVIPVMKERGGSVINLSSIAGLRPRSHLVGYCSAKAAVAMLSKSTALHYAEKGYRMRCNSLHPGAIHTAMLEKAANQTDDPEGFLAQLRAQAPLGHLGHTDDIASMAVYLGSDESAFVTGTEMVVDGGTVLH